MSFSIDESNQWSGVVLASEYSLNSEIDLSGSESSHITASAVLSSLSSLSPVGGIPLLDHWLRLYRLSGVSNVFIVTDSLHHPLLVDWALTRGLSPKNILKDDKEHSELSNRDSISSKLHAALRVLLQGENKNVLIVRDNTLFQNNFNLKELLSQIPSDSGAVVYSDNVNIYDANSADILALPMYSVLEKTDASVTCDTIEYKEKKKEKKEKKKNFQILAAYRSTSYPHLLAFTESSSHRNKGENKEDNKEDNTEDNTDILSKLSEYMLEKDTKIFSYRVTNIFKITPSTYNTTNNYFTELLKKHEKNLPKMVTQHCPARVGLMGNPSDGFGGKTLSFLIRNFEAQVTIRENERVTKSERNGEDDSNSSSGDNCGSNHSDSSRDNSGDNSRGNYSDNSRDNKKDNSRDVTLVPHPVLDPSSFGDMGQLQLHTINKGYYGGIRLLQATCKSFSECCTRAGIVIHLQRGFSMSYDTNIPRMVGLSGSSAIVVAVFRALLTFYGLSLQDLNIEKTDFPKTILDIERVELEIACGLQDRVVQTYGGLVHMDFTGPSNIYTELDILSVPEMYIAYNINAGGESGKVHSTVKARWLEKDPSLIAGMKALGQLTDLAVSALRRGDRQALALLMDRNFALRRELYGDGPVGELNIRMVLLASSLGFSAKFTGSGGALLCLQRNGQGWLSPEAEVSAVESFRIHGFCLQRIRVA